MSEQKLDAVRERWNGRQDMREREWLRTNAHRDRVTNRPHFFRFSIFIQRIKRAARAEARFAEHCRLVAGSARRLAA